MRTTNRIWIVTMALCVRATLSVRTSFSNVAIRDRHVEKVVVNE